MNDKALNTFEELFDYVNEHNLVDCAMCGEFKPEDQVPEDMCLDCLGDNDDQ